MGTLDFIVIGIVVWWWIAGIALIVGAIWQGGWPDYETEDGPAIDWDELFWSSVVAIAAAPFWYWLIWAERRSPSLSPGVRE